MPKLRVRVLDCANMRSNAYYLLEELSKPTLMIMAFCWMLLSLCLLQFPLNVAIAFVPLYIAFFYANREELRRIRLGFVHDRVREIPYERMQQALDYIERERSKTKPLP